MRWVHTLYGRLALSLFCLLLLTGILYAVLSLMLTQQQRQSSSQVLNRELAANLASEMKLVRDGKIDAAMVEQGFHVAMLINPSIEIYLLDADGTIRAYSADPAKVRRTRVAVEPIRRFLAEASTVPLLGDDPRDPMRQKVFSATALPDATVPQGYLYVVLQGEEVDAVAGSADAGYLQRFGLVALAGSLAVSLALGLLLFASLTRRLTRLSRALGAFRAGGFRDTGDAALAVEVGGRDEIGQLADSFAEMARRISEQFRELEQQDRLRRELVANVSHDLRTPLAALHGYLETLQHKGSQLSDDERDEFLAIALRHSERLARLVSDLFELAKLDAREVEPASEPFPLTELVQDVVQKYALRAQQAGIALDFSAPEALPMVAGDLGLIERVLDNLVDNALGHTPPGGRVTLTLTAESDGVRLVVADSGRGIPEAELPHLFQRFHQVDNAHRGGDHSGLGLAIAKRILELHDAAIDVSSRLGEGTAFGFHLPLAGSGSGR